VHRLAARFSYAGNGPYQIVKFAGTDQSQRALGGNRVRALYARRKLARSLAHRQTERKRERERERKRELSKLYCGEQCLPSPPLSLSLSVDSACPLSRFKSPSLRPPSSFSLFPASFFSIADANNEAMIKGHGELHSFIPPKNASTCRQSLTSCQTNNVRGKFRT